MSTRQKNIDNDKLVPYFVQFMLKNHVITLDNAVQCVKKVRKDFNEVNLKLLVQEINLKISQQSFKIEKIRSELTGEPMLIWINMLVDKASLGQCFSQEEIQYFNLLVKELITSEGNTITYVDAINLAATVLKSAAKKSLATEFLHTWTCQGYFDKMDNDLFLGPKIKLECSQFLKESIPNSDCFYCHDLSLHGQTCDSCGSRFHRFCIKEMKVEACPKCKNQF